jgi:predicted nuclease of predicted toxin-antitoxin system
VGLRNGKDPAIWDYALRNQAVIVTKDEDFVDRFRRQASGPVIVWLRIGNAGNAALLGWYLPVLPAIVSRIQSGDRFIEIR